MVRRFFGMLLCGIALSGCAVRQVHKDHDLIRSTLLDLYTDQIIDNLVRAANDMPIIQVDYTQATAMVTNTNSISGSDTQAITANNALTIPVAALAATRTIMTTLMGNLGNMNANQVTIQAAPVTTSNEVYDAYLQYLSEPGSLMISDDAPPPGAAHICKKYHGRYFWVPSEFRGKFFKLALQTTAQRGKPVVTADAFFTVTLTQLVSDEPSAIGTAHVLTVQLDGTIPIGMGHLVLDNDQAGQQLQVETFANKTIRFSVEDAKMPLFRTLPQTGKIYLLNIRPAPPTTEDLINRVNFQLQQIQFNQLRQPGP